MGVMACARYRCTNIMCNRYSPDYGYICESCFEELCESRMGIEDFMDSDKASYVGRKEDLKNVYGKIFKGGL